MQIEPEQFAQKLAAVEHALEVERNNHLELSGAIRREALERQEAILWQEHRLVAAARSLYQFRNNPDLRWAAAGGLLSAFIGRSATTAVAGGGLLALIVTAALALQANYLLALQTERMDVQTIVMDAQRRTQNFQAEFSAISTEVTTQLRPLRAKSYDAIEGLSADLRGPLEDLAAEILRQTTGDIEVDQKLHSFSTFIRVEMQQGRFSSESLYEIEKRSQYIYPLLPLEMTEKLKKASEPARQIVEDYIRKLPQDIVEGLDMNMNGGGHFYQLDAPTRLRIAGLSQAVRPSPIIEFAPRAQADAADAYFINNLKKYFSDPSLGARSSLVKLSDQKISAERGQLLTLLATERVWLPPIFRAGADFSASDLSSRTLGPLALAPNAKFANTNFIGSMLQEIRLEGDFRNADFRCASFVKVALAGAQLTGARFAGAIFMDSSVTLSSKIFAETDMDQVDLSNFLLEVLPDQYNSIRGLGSEESAPFGDVLAKLEPMNAIDLKARYQNTLVHKAGTGPWRISQNGRPDKSSLCKSLGVQQ